MEPVKIYTLNDKLRDLITDNSTLLMVMDRFGISLGFGDKSIYDVCSSQGVDCNTFLTVANYVSGRRVRTDSISLEHLIKYLEHAHKYFLSFNLPNIRKKLIEGVNSTTDVNASMSLIKFFDQYYQEVAEHMNYEETNVFTYVHNLVNGIKPDDYSIANFEQKHDKIEEKISTLKDMIVRYTPKSSNDLMYSALYDIINCEHDLILHRKVEDRIFVPAVKNLERKILSNPRKQENLNDDKNDICILSDREKDVLVCVAQGMTSKEIADKLFISVNTVTKHRYNITSKLRIHTSAGLAHYAFSHGLVKPM